MEDKTMFRLKRSQKREERNEKQENKQNTKNDSSKTKYVNNYIKYNLKTRKKGEVFILLLYLIPIILLSWSSYTMNHYTWHVISKYMILEEEKQEQIFSDEIKDK